MVNSLERVKDNGGDRMGDYLKVVIRDFKSLPHSILYIEKQVNKTC